MGNKPFYRQIMWRIGNSFGWWRVPFCPHCKRQLGTLLEKQKPDKCPMCMEPLEWEG